MGLARLLVVQVELDVRSYSLSLISYLDDSD